MKIVCTAPPRLASLCAKRPPADAAEERPMCLFCSPRQLAALRALAPSLPRHRRRRPRRDSGCPHPRPCPRSGAGGDRRHADRECPYHHPRSCPAGGGSDAIRGDRILAVGARRDLEGYRGPQTQVIDAGGRRVISRGLIDARAFPARRHLLRLRNCVGRRALAGGCAGAAARPGAAGRPAELGAGGRWLDAGAIRRTSLPRPWRRSRPPPATSPPSCSTCMSAPSSTAPGGGC